MAAERTEVTAAARRTVVEPVRYRYKRLQYHLQRYRRMQQTLRHQHVVLPTSRSRVADPSNQTDFLINFPGSPTSINGLKVWLTVLHRLHRDAPVAILVGDVSAYQAVRSATLLPCYFGRAATEAEYVAQQLQTKVMVYVNQSKLNLREGGFHDMAHVFLGAPDGSRSRWLNNRLRLFDYVLAPDEESKQWMDSRLMGFDADKNVRVVGRQQHSDNRLDHLGARLLGGDSDVVSRGVDLAACVEELLRIRDERDRLVRERDQRLAEQGITLLKGGQA